MFSYHLVVNDIDINIKKLETDEFEFNLIINDNDYYGNSFLRDLQFINKFKEYIDFCGNNIKCQKINGNYILELPIPFSDKYQLIDLIKIDYKQQIQELQNEVDNLDKLNNTLNELNKEYNYMYSLFNGGSGNFLPYCNSDRIDILMVRNDAAMVADYKPYISKSNLFNPAVVYNYKLSLAEITYGREPHSMIDPYVELSRFGYKEIGSNYIEIMNTVLSIVGYKTIKKIEMDNGSGNGKYVYMRIHIDNSKKDKVKFIHDIGDKHIKFNKIHYNHHCKTINSMEEIILYYE